MALLSLRWIKDDEHRAKKWKKSGLQPFWAVGKKCTLSCASPVATKRV
jgi:hypothetical protein